jgi:hypothetical protein
MNTFLFAHLAPFGSIEIVRRSTFQATEVSDHFEIRDPGDRDTGDARRKHDNTNGTMPPCFQATRVRATSMQDTGAFLINLGILSSSFVWRQSARAVQFIHAVRLEHLPVDAVRMADSRSVAAIELGWASMSTCVGL